MFVLHDNDFAGLSSLHSTGLVPTFGDINGDGHADLLVGDSDGKIIYVRYNTSENTFNIITQNYLDIDVGEFSTPQLFDLNKNGVNDLIIGEKSGNIVYYKNVGDLGNPNFIFVTDSLGKINITDPTVSNFGYSVPSFFIDKDQHTGLTVGSEQGMVYYFTNIDDNINGKFTKSNHLNLLLDTANINFDRGLRTSAVICDLYSGGKLEMIAGNYSGGLEYFNGSADVMYDNIAKNINNKLDIYPNPAKSEIVINLAKTSEVVNVSLYDVVGFKIKSKLFTTANKSITFSLPNVDNGVYFVITTIGNKVYANKIIVDR